MLHIGETDGWLSRIVSLMTRRW